MITKDIKDRYLILLIIGILMPLISFLAIRIDELIYLDFVIRVGYCIVLFSLCKLNRDMGIVSIFKLIGAMAFIAPFILIALKTGDETGSMLYVLDSFFGVIGGIVLDLGLTLIGFIGDILEYLTQAKIVEGRDDKLAKGWKSLLFWQGIPLIFLLVCTIFFSGLYQLVLVIAAYYIATYLYLIVKIYYLFKTYHLFKRSAEDL